jgi:transcriptional regulator with XRE-family HTH domain
MDTKDILKALRTNKNLTQRDVSEKSGVSYSAYQKYESGEREMGATAVKKLADFYGVTTDYLLGRSDDKSDALAKLAEDFDMAVLEKHILDKYLNLPKDKRTECMAFLHESVEEIRRESAELRRKSTYTCAELEEFQQEEQNTGNNVG